MVPTLSSRVGFILSTSREEGVEAREEHLALQVPRRVALVRREWEGWSWSPEGAREGGLCFGPRMPTAPAAPASPAECSGRGGPLPVALSPSCGTVPSLQPVRGCGTRAAGLRLPAALNLPQRCPQCEPSSCKPQSRSPSPSARSRVPSHGHSGSSFPVAKSQSTPRGFIPDGEKAPAWQLLFAQVCPHPLPVPELCGLAQTGLQQHP